MGKCKICNADVNEESIYCDKCSELFLEPQDADEILPDNPLSVDKKDMAIKEGLESYVPKNYSIFDTTEERITGNKEFESLLNPTSLVNQSNDVSLEKRTKNPSLESQAENPSLESQAENPLLESQAENPLLESQAENPLLENHTENDSLQVETIFSQAEDLQKIQDEVQKEFDVIHEAETDDREEQESELNNHENKIIQDDEITELLASILSEETAATQEKTSDEVEDKKTRGNEDDTIDDSTYWNKNEETEGEFAVGSTPEFDGNQDILDLLNEINRTPEENNHADYTSDVLSIDDFMGNEEASEDPILSLYGAPDSTLDPSVKDIGGIYQDALGGISSLEDVGIDEELLKLIPDVTSPEDGQDKKFSDLELQGKTNKSSKKKKQKGPRKSLFAKIFGNVKENITEEEKEERKLQIIEDANKKEKKQKEAEQAKKSEVAKKKADRIAAKKKAQDDTAKAKQAKAEKAKAKKEEKERLSREIQELIDEIDENEGRINRIGASFVFALFASIALFVVIGTNIYSYAINIQNATKSFSMQRYNDAYNEVYGLDIKDEDIEIYDKIMTVMFVNKQLNSYNNYSSIGMYPEALDSLLKGLERYDKYYALATKLGIQTDLDYVRNQIVNELDSVFLLSVEEAYDIINQPDQTEYSIAVYNKVYENLDEKLIQTTEK